MFFGRKMSNCCRFQRLYTLFTFACGAVFGYFFQFSTSNHDSLLQSLFAKNPISKSFQPYDQFLTHEQISKKLYELETQLKSTFVSLNLNGIQIDNLNDSYGKDDEIRQTTGIARNLGNKIRVVCLILTFQDNLESRAIPIFKTWGRHCNKILFVTTKPDIRIPTFIPSDNFNDTYENLYGKVKRAFKYVYDNYIDEYDWVFKADDDTFAIIENMRLMLRNKDPNELLYYGFRFNQITKQGYMSGGAVDRSYHVDIRVTNRWAQYAFHNETICRGDDQGAEDAEIGVCLENVGVLAQDSRDEFGKGRFFPFDPIWHATPVKNEDKDYWYYTLAWYPPDNVGLNCCSTHVISFHYVKPEDFYLLEYLIYHIIPFGGSVTYNFTLPIPPSTIPPEITTFTESTVTPELLSSVTSTDNMNTSMTFSEGSEVPGTVVTEANSPDGTGNQSFKLDTTESVNVTIRMDTSTKLYNSNVSNS